MHRLILIAPLLLGCPDDSIVDTNVDSTDTETVDSDTTDDPVAPPSAGTVTITVGVYEMDDSGGYTALNVDPLVFDVGVSCQMWDRVARAHGSLGGLDAAEEAHDHFNAGDDTSWVDGTFTWTEYGPEHSLGDAEVTCAAGVGGVTKSVTETDYFEDKPGVYLRIDSVDEP
jgi:hypothetical protein